MTITENAGTELEITIELDDTENLFESQLNASPVRKKSRYVELKEPQIETMEEDDDRTSCESYSESEKEYDGGGMKCSGTATKKPRSDKMDEAKYCCMDCCGRDMAWCRRE